MSGTIDADEKRRLLRERRQAKMSSKASDRLNTILTSGSSVKETVTSPLEKRTTSPSPVPENFSSATSSDVKIPLPTNSVGHHDDPEDVDISVTKTVGTPSQLNGAASNANAPEDIDEMLNRLFGAGAAAGNANGAGSAGEPFPAFGAGATGGEDPFKMMMNMMGGGEGFGANGGVPGAMGDESAGFPAADPFAAYNLQQHRQTKYYFLIIRYVTTFVNFFYHYYHQSSALQSASHSYVRGINSQTTGFFTWFATLEVLILASYYVISAQRKYIVNNGHFILKGLSMLSMVLPQAQRYQPLVVQALGYWDILGMFIGDVALVIILFGFLSCLG
ncbi:golgi to ER traffic protein 2 [[Candida] anglica]|uniref:Golgi to ER traffic protein 2 n=1 Tax=[Candida] anglica TaxID=148631 RepID=A0ABP0EBP8_9ASCO